MFAGRFCISRVLVSVLLMVSVAPFAGAGYKPVEGKIMTRWAKDVSPKDVQKEYPRPQMVREEWQSLNGLWDYAIRGRNAGRPAKYDGEILVPFAIESALSGVGKTVGKDNRLWYHRTLDLPAKWRGQRILLHFGAVDWEATVWVNGKEVGGHKGGYDPFTVDITGALKESGSQEIVVSVWDPTNDGPQPRGKQVKDPRGIWYTSVTGIWQSVWVEPVAETYIRSIKITPDVDAGVVQVEVDAVDADGVALQAKAKGPGFEGVAEVVGSNLMRIRIHDARLWSPDSPYLYDLAVSIKKDGKTIDEVASYFGMRKIAIEKDEAGINRLFLNNKPLFQYGPLDQGWWPDGLYTAPTDEALRYDIEVLKKLGCNMLRKHVKAEPDRLYYWCDKLGLLVWQDMPSARHIESFQEQFELEWKRIIDALYNHPSIVMWVPFNEGWGQYDTERITNWTKQYDPSRLVNNASGWTDKNVGDVHDIHSYPGPACPPLEENRAAVLGEFGGLGLPLAGHTWQEEKNWGYRSYENQNDLTDAYVNLIGRLRSLIGEGLSAAVYTQTTDVEVEVNGMMTYDREVIKIDPELAAAANRKLYLPPPIVTTAVATSEKKAVQWKYTTSPPADGWYKSDFDDSAWKQGSAGFGTKMTPGTVVRTEWNTSDIWVRRSFELAGTDLGEVQLMIHHDEDAEIYINGELVAKTTGYTTNYSIVPLNKDAADILRKGKNTIAIHCKQTMGGQYIDAGLVSVKEQAAR